MRSANAFKTLLALGVVFSARRRGVPEHPAQRWCRWPGVPPNIVGQRAAIQRALARLDTAVDSDPPVLITGETGVGEELRACASRQRSAHAPFVAMSCDAVPGALFEAERFGHARGSFTSADRARAGLVARAEGGSLLHSGARRASDDRERAGGDPTLRRHERFAPC